MLKWKKNKTGDIATEQLTDSTSDGTSTEIDLTWLGRISDLEQAILLHQQMQALGLNGTAAPASSSSSSSSPALLASAADLDLTTSGSFGAIGDGLFLTTPIQSGGTGQFDTFVQIQHNGTEQGYNTDHRPQQFDEQSSANHNHSLLLSNVAIVIGDGSNGTNEGTVYREFLLDANEQSGGGKNFLSLDRLQIFQETSGNLTGFTPGTGFGAPLEHLVYDLDAGADRWIALDASFSSGSGQSDMRLLIPDVLFDQSLPYVVVYSGFGFQGNGWTTDGGFEEWGVDTANSPGGGGNAFLNITKSATVPGGTANAAGEVIAYAIRVSNTGSTNLTGITVTDPFVSNLLRGADIVGNNDTVLNAGEIWSYSADHTVTQNELDTLNFIDNTATADSDQTGPDSASASVPVERNVHVTLTKNAMIVGGAVDAPGDVIHYRLTATNDGSITLTTPTVSDPQFTVLHPIEGAPVGNPDAQIFIPISDGDYNLGDTDNDGVVEATDQNGVQDPGETFQYAYPGDFDLNGRHDPGETWTAFNLGDADNDGVLDPGETFVGDANNNGVEDNGEQWQFKNLGDTDQDNIQDPGETWQYVNAGDDNQNGVEDGSETFLYHNAGDTNQNGFEDPGEDFQFYNAGDTNQNGEEDDGETFQFLVTNTVVSVDNDDDGFNDGDTNLDGNLSVGETWKYAGTYTATQDDIDNRDQDGIPTFDPALTHDNTATVTTDQEASDTASASVPIAQNPHVTLTKNAAVIGGVVDQAGDVIHYRINVTNDGNMTLTGADVSDPSVGDLADVDANNDNFNDGDSNVDGELDIGETWKYTASYTATQADIDNRDSEGVPTVDPALTHDNTATFTADQPATESASASVPIAQNPHVTVTKNAAVIGGVVDQAGDVIHYRINVTNDGNMTLTGTDVSDPSVSDLAGVDADNDMFNDGDSNVDGELDIGETWKYTASYTATQADIDNGGVVDDNLTHDNTASVTTDQGATGSASASVPIDQNPDLRIAKTSDVTSVDAAGDVINYTVTVENLGNMTLTGLAVSDSLVTLTRGADAVGDNDAVFEVGETWSYAGSYEVQQSDIDNGGVVDPFLTIDNTATADTGQTDPEEASASVAVDQNPDLEIIKSSDVSSVDEAGDVINYTVTVENLGNMTLTGLIVDDPLVDLVYASGDVNEDGRLDRTETWTYTGSYTVLQSDIDSNGGGDGDIDNTATADSDQTDAEQASHAVTIVPPPAFMSLDISDAAGSHWVDSNENGVGNAGDLIQFAIVLRNLSSSTLTSIMVSDLLGDAVPGNFQTAIPASLAPAGSPGDTWSSTYNHTLTPADDTANHVLDQLTVTALDSLSQSRIIMAQWDQFFP